HPRLSLHPPPRRITNRRSTNTSPFQRFRNSSRRPGHRTRKCSALRRKIRLEAKRVERTPRTKITGTNTKNSYSVVGHRPRRKQTSNQNERTNMTKTSKNKVTSLKIIGLLLALGALPLVGGLTGCAGNRYTQSTGERIDDHGDSS